MTKSFSIANVKGFICFGIGDIFYKVLSENPDIHIIALVDNNPALWDTPVFHKDRTYRIQNPKYISQYPDANILITLNPHLDIREQLNGIDKERIFLWFSMYKENHEIKTSVVLNRINRKNLGARTTCRALDPMMNSAGIRCIDTFDNNFCSYISRSSAFEKIADEIEKQNSMEARNLLEKIESSDYFIINGEGSMNFGVFRPELKFHYAMMKIAKSKGCKTFYVNTLCSAGRNNTIRGDYVDEANRFIQFCDEFVVRDPLSHNFADSYMQTFRMGGVKYIPEALFSFARKYAFLGDIPIPTGDVLLPYPEQISDLGKIDLAKPYVLISGSSEFSAKYPPGAATLAKYIQLSRSLQKMGSRVVLIETSGSETYLRAIGKACNTPVISCQNNFVLLYWVLMNAKVFISGRFHPSIVASAAGVPCILFTSNSHKSAAYYSYFKEIYACSKVYSACLENPEDISEILLQVQDYIANSGLRTKIKHRANELALQSQREYRALFASNQ